MTDSAEAPAVRRRTVLTTVGATATVALAGCAGGNNNDGGGGDGGDGGDGGGGDGGDGGGGATVAAGPDGELVFEPEEVTIGTGETVTWEFESPSHNVSAWPDMHEEISIPDGASGFGTMPQDGDPLETVPEGETFEHTFETAGEYTYVCVPHAGADMVGTVIVE